MDMQSFASKSEKQNWNARVRHLVDSLTSFTTNARNAAYNFVVDENLLGYVRVDVIDAIRKYDTNNFFSIDDTCKHVTFSSNYSTYTDRTQALNTFLTDMKERNLFKSLKGWRNEKYEVKERFSMKSLLEIERAAVCVFGVLSYGCHINGYVKENNEYKLWISRRSATKQTYPGLLDNLSAGGLTAGLGLIECAKKELEEECGLSDANILNKIRPVDAITYAYECEEGIYREGEFIFDLKLPSTFIPHGEDGEVQEFYLMTVSEVKQAIGTNDFKPNSALITLNFLMRKGLINADTDPNYLYILEKMHAAGY